MTTDSAVSLTLSSASGLSTSSSRQTDTARSFSLAPAETARGAGFPGEGGRAASAETAPTWPPNSLRTALASRSTHSTREKVPASRPLLPSRRRATEKSGRLLPAPPPPPPGLNFEEVPLRTCRVPTQPSWETEWTTAPPLSPSPPHASPVTASSCTGLSLQSPVLAE